MNSITTITPVEDHRSRWLLWRIVVPVLTLLFVVYPAVMPPPPHPGMGLFTAPAEAAIPMQARTTDSCPPMDMCGITTVEQALPRLPIPPALLITFVVILFAAQRPLRPLAARYVWWRPPDQRRALLQVFLI